MMDENNQLIQGYQHVTTDENGNQQLVFVPLTEAEEQQQDQQNQMLQQMQQQEQDQQAQQAGW